MKNEINPVAMKLTITKTNLLNKNNQKSNFSTLSVNEMINIKGGGTEGQNNPPILK
jgi:hypothetical protein